MKTIKQVQDEITDLQSLEARLHRINAGILSKKVVRRLAAELVQVQAQINALKWVLEEDAK